ncbi:MAG: hypothetical protein ACREQI_02985 [Candidatus Binataceae bacterium]
MALAEKNSKSNASSKKEISVLGSQPKYVLCIKNDEYPASLEVRKVYRVLPDSQAIRHGLIRVIDESAEDYLYPASFFVPISLPQGAKAAFGPIEASNS